MINKVILVGNVGADPEIRTLDSGVKTARVRLATTERFFTAKLMKPLSRLSGIQLFYGAVLQMLLISMSVRVARYM